MLGQFLFDSAFANGAYSHSFGLESYISWGVVKDASSFQKWLESYMLDIFATSDGAIYAIACGLKGKKLSLLKLAKVANSSMASAECKAAGISMARATLKNTEFMHDEYASWYYKACENDEFCNPAIAFSVLGQNMAVEYAYSSIKTLTQNATRAIPLSYKKSSELLHINLDLAKRSADKSMQIAKSFIEKGFFSLQLLDENDLNKYHLFSTHHELDLGMLAHEKLDFRLFMS
ncbi:hypothetical protein AVBRAN9334_09095 [Campylobacter sp. RM9334]|uniref:urease accessory protein UreF n=1 Tax=Campylobacter sp. RM9334 TaxID=2735732 RepID=UPI001DD1184A|nr:hypothetical protein [Campylobacter sp. RM9334]